MNIEAKLQEIEEISYAALEREIGPYLGPNIVSRLKKSGCSKIPSLEQLLVGDIILCKYNSKSKSKKKHPVEAHQISKLKHSFDHAQWTHAMVYVGNLFVAESQTFFKKPKRIGRYSGTRIHSIVDYSETHDLKICRHKALQDFPDLRQSVGRYAVLDTAINPRKYPWKRVLQMGFRKVLDTPKLHQAVMCSELALEALAIQGRVMVEDYNNLNNGNAFYPADFHARDEFENIDIEYFNLVDE